MEPIVERRPIFLTLDALRGVAAVSVVVFHYRALFATRFFAHGYLAVDFFYVLSGFVLTYAYADRLEGGWSLTALLKVRLIRLYPLYLLGLLLGLLFFELVRHFARLHAESGSVLLAVGANLLMLPTTALARNGARILYPFNASMWSLFFELAANVYHALLLRGRGLVRPLLLTVASAVVLAACSVRMGRLDFGIGVEALWYGIPRVLFSYTLGVVLFRLWSRRPRRRTLPAWLVLVLLLAVLAAPALARTANVLYDLGAAFVIFPAIVFLGPSCVPGQGTARLCRGLGLISYALYVLHEPLTSIFLEAWHKLSGHEAVLDAPWSGLLCLVLLGLAALMADALYDLPVRSFLRRRLSSRTG